MGFWISWEKCELEPKQRIEFLGTEIDSLKMVFYVPQEKLIKLRKQIKSFLKKEKTTPKEASSIVGKISSMTAALAHSSMHFRALTMTFHIMLVLTKNNYLKKIKTPTAFSKELILWETKIKEWNGRSLLPVLNAIMIQTDAASTKGWGGIRLDTQEYAQGLWSEQEKRLPINILELKGIENTLIS